MVCSTMRVLGLMSGTSLDGLDLALVDLSYSDGKYSYELVDCSTLKYSKEWLLKLSSSRTLNGLELTELNHEYGVYLGTQVNDFIGDRKVDLISSHGHTVFHQPNKGFTLQIGSVHGIATTTHIQTIGDYRTWDVAKGGQGAPLVPVGDELLFSEYDYCINLGGMSNISFKEDGVRKAFDVSPCNIVSNLLMNEIGKEYDLNGDVGRQGEVDQSLLEHLNAWGYYSSEQSSLGIEDLESDFIPDIKNAKLTLENKLRTYYEHIGMVIGSQLKKGNCLITGGGAKNEMLVESIQKYAKAEIVLPEENVIDFKEAIVFAFLGFLKVNEKVNVLKSVTGASSDSVAGTWVLPK